MSDQAEPATHHFVPVTFLPGENVVAVEVEKVSQSPGVLVQIDELEEPLPVGTRLEILACGGAWLAKAKDFDDRTWKNVEVSGELNQFDQWEPDWCERGWTSPSAPHLVATGGRLVDRPTIHLQRGRRRL